MIPKVLFRHRLSLKSEAGNILGKSLWLYFDEVGTPMSTDENKFPMIPHRQEVHKTSRLWPVHSRFLTQHGDDLFTKLPPSHAEAA